MADRLTRFVNVGGLRIEKRSEGGSPLIVGHAAVFNEWTSLYRGKTFELREVIRPGAFRNALAEGQDVRALFDHDSGKVLGRTRSGTLKLSEDARGLLSEIAPPDTPTGREVLTLIERGDVSGMSFAFSARAGGMKSSTTTDEQGRDIYEDELTDLDLFDVSVVTYPAYDATDVSLRAKAIDAERIERRAAWFTERRNRMDRVLQSIAGK